MGSAVVAGSIEGVVWVKSGRSAADGNCVEVAGLSGGGAAVRNSRDPHGPVLFYTRGEIVAFIQGAKDGDFDHLIG
ncbi:DUF397 domain-containing protein [Streptomyces sp. NBC_00868]|uniref:DUF397 domain-containing protein n=1 Tax=unclassified Streptomyces TaxID=2593676 RepID=UPI0032447A53|nr:DUF397 domain-containing protein [Streptomyces sp. NBC_00868]